MDYGLGSQLPEPLETEGKGGEPGFAKERKGKCEVINYYKRKRK
jgi:hypothetical protein